jgi:hypothetical protein
MKMTKKFPAVFVAILMAALLAGCASTYMYDASVQPEDCATLIINGTWRSPYNINIRKMDGVSIYDMHSNFWSNGDTVLIPAGYHILEWWLYDKGKTFEVSPVDWHFEAGKTYTFDKNGTISEIRPD